MDFEDSDRGYLRFRARVSHGGIDLVREKDSEEIYTPQIITIRGGIE